MSRASKIKKQYATNAEFVKVLTGISSEEVCEMQYKTGVRYAEQKFGHEHFVTLILQSEQYWIWWKNCWSRRDEQLIDDLIQIDAKGQLWLKEGLIENKGIITMINGALYMLLTKNLAIKAFNTIHSLKYLNEYPHKAILEEAYNTMIHKYVKTITKQ